MKIIAGIQARMGSERFPGKVMADLCGMPVIQHVISRAKMLDVDGVCLLTTDLEEDKVLSEIARDNEIDCMRFENKTLECFQWYLKMIRAYDADYIIRICGDSPFFDYQITNAIIKHIKLEFEGYDSDYFSTWINGVWGIMHKSGIATEIIKADVFLKQSEHATFWFHKPTSQFGIKLNGNKLNWKCSIDYPKDLECCKRIIARLGRAPLNYLEIDANMPDEYRITDVEQKY